MKRTTKYSLRLLIWFLVLNFSLLFVPHHVFAQTADFRAADELLEGDSSEDDLLKAQQQKTTSQQQTPSGEVATQQAPVGETAVNPQPEETVVTQGTAPEGEVTDVSTETLSTQGDALNPADSSAAQNDGTQANPTEAQIDPNKDVIEMSKGELDQLQEDIAKIEDPALKSEMLSVVAQEMQIVVVDTASSGETTDDNSNAQIDIATSDGQTQALQQLDGNASALVQNGVSQQTISALKEAIGSGDKGKVEALMSEMAQNFHSPAGGTSGGPAGDFDKASMPMMEMMRDFGFQPGPMEMGQMGEMPAGAHMEIVDFKEFYSGVRVEEMGLSMMEKGGFSSDQIDQFTEKAKQEIFNHQGEGAFDPRMAFEGIFKEVFGSGPMMEGQGPMGHPGTEAFGPNGSMEAMMAQGGPNAAMGAPAEFAFNGPQGNFNFNEFLSQNNNMMGEIAFMSNPDNFNYQGPGGPQGWEGQGQFSGSGPFAGGPMGPGDFAGFPQGPLAGGPMEGPIPVGFDPSAGGFQGPMEGFQAQEFQAPEFQAPEYQPPPPPPEPLPPPPEPPPPPQYHHDLGETPHIPGDAHNCTLPQCS